MGKTGLWFVDKYRSFRKKCGKPDVSAKRIRRCRQLYPKEEPEEYLRRQDGRLVAEIGIVLLAGIILFAVVRQREEKPEEISFLKRPDYGEGQEYYRLLVQEEDEEPLSIEIPVEDRVYTEEEAKEKFEGAYDEICRNMLGENESLEKVTFPLTLPEKALGGTVKADWTSQNKMLLDDWGEIVKSSGKISKEGETGAYLLELSCGEYSCEYEISVTVYPAEGTEKEMFLRELEERLADLSEKSLSSKTLLLPQEHDGRNLSWYMEQDRSGRYLILILPIASAVLLIMGNRQKQKEMLRDRENELLFDYPELIWKFTVLLQAGLTTRNVWERMVKEYGKKKEKDKKSRYAYEEMEITLNQLKNGVYESKAYGEFGLRCGLHPYLKFGTLLEQNLRQGTTGLSVRLKEEVFEAFEERKNLARRMGEEAETKLMLPMFMMLIMVLVIIMVPAFLAF